MLDLNSKGKVFSNYEVFWEEERNEIDLHHKLKTNYDFLEANKATQKAINQVKEA